MRLTVVVFVAASLVGTIATRGAEAPAAGPERVSSWTNPLAAVRSIIFDDQVIPAGHRSSDADAVYDGESSASGLGHDDGGYGCGHHHDGCCSGGCGSGCCDSCGGGGCCGHGCCDHCCYDDGCLLNGSGCGPCARFRAEFLPLQRSTSNEVIGFGGTFTTNDFDFTFVPGVRAAAEVQVGCDCSLEALYLGLHRWDEEVVIDLGAGGLLGASYTSQLHGGEVNYWMPIRCCCCRIQGAFMFGARYFDLHEEFAFDINSINQADIETDNRFLAAHLGFLLMGHLKHGFSVRWDGKAGGGANLTSRNTAVGGINFPRQEDADGAFIGDTSVVFSYALSCHCSVYTGYYLLWVDGLALAPQQFPLPPTQIDDNGFLLFQGGVAGVETTW